MKQLDVLGMRLFDYYVLIICNLVLGIRKNIPVVVPVYSRVVAVTELGTENTMP